MAINKSHSSHSMTKSATAPMSPRVGPQNSRPPRLQTTHPTPSGWFPWRASVKPPAPPRKGLTLRQWGLILTLTNPRSALRPSRPLIPTQIATQESCHSKFKLPAAPRPHCFLARRLQPYRFTLMPMRAKLIGLDDCDEPVPVQLDGFPVTVGRSRDLQWTLDDRWVSRHHCVIDFEDGRLVVKDLGSKHGTFVNNRQIDTAILEPGDKLSIGMCTFVVAYEKESVAVEAGVE